MFWWERLTVPEPWTPSSVIMGTQIILGQILYEGVPPDWASSDKLPAQASGPDPTHARLQIALSPRLALAGEPLSNWIVIYFSLDGVKHVRACDSAGSGDPRYAML